MKVSSSRREKKAKECAEFGISIRICKTRVKSTSYIYFKHFSNQEYKAVYVYRSVKRPILESESEFASNLCETFILYFDIEICELQKVKIRLQRSSTNHISIRITIIVT